MIKLTNLTSLTISIGLLSSQILFAQNNSQVTGDRLQALSREQGTGNRGQVRNTNQATGDRLQGTGAEMTELPLVDLSFQIDRGGKTTTNDNNQVAGYRLQVAGSKATELPSDLSFQIGQRVEPNTKYQVRTANCNNQSDNFDCYLMMDPKAAEEGVQAVEEGLRIFTPAQARKAAQEREATAKASADARLAVPTPKKALPSQSQWVRANKAPETTAAAVPMDVANPILEEPAVVTFKTDSTPAVSETVTRENDGVSSLQNALQLLMKLGLPSLSTIPTIENILSLELPAHNDMTMQDMMDCYVQEDENIINEENKSLVVSIKRLESDDHTIIGTKKQGSIHGLFDPITLSLENGEKVVYQPNAIICHEDSKCISEDHSISYRREGDRWFKVENGKNITAIDVTNGSEDDKNIEKNCYVISYEKASNGLLSQSASTDEVQEVSPLQNHRVQEVHVKTSVTPTKQLVPVSSAERKEQTTILNAMSGAVSERNKKDIEKRYQQADILWRDAQKAWDNRRVTQQKADHTGEVLVRTQERHERAEQALAAIDINQTILGRVATYAAVAGDALSGATDPHVKLVGFVAKGTSKVAQLVNKQWTEADVNSAKDALNHAEKEHIDTKHIAEEAKLIVPDIDKKAAEAEEGARALEISETINLAKTLRAPVQDWDIAYWTLWADKIVSMTGLDSSWATRIAHQGKNDPSWAAKEVAVLWEKRISLSDENLRKKEKAKFTAMEIFEKDFQQANDHLEVARKNVHDIKNEILGSTKLQVDATVQLDRSEKELQDKDTEENRKKLREAFGHLLKISESLKVYEDKLSQCNTVLDQKIKEAQQKDQQKCMAENAHNAHIERAKIHAEADKVAWKSVWPENSPLVQYPWEIPVLYPSSSVMVGKNGVSQEIRLLSKLAYVDEVQGADGAQKLSVQKLLDASSTGATKQFTAEVEFGKKSIRPPLISDDVYEIIGRALLEKRKKGNVSTQQVDKNSMGNAGIQSKESEHDEILNNNGAGKNILPEITEPTEADLARWNARKKADEAHSRAIDIQTELKHNIPKRTIEHSDSWTASTTHDDSISHARRANDEALSLEEEWFALALLADKERVQCGGVPFSSAEDVRNAWKKADGSSVKVMEEYDRIKKEKEEEVRSKEFWDTHSRRWIAFDEANKLNASAKRLEQEIPTKTKDNSVAWTAYLRKVDDAKAAAKKAMEDWNSLADREMGETNTQEQKEKATKKLRAADRAVTNLWQEVLSRYQQENKNNGSLQNQKLGNYQVQLILNRNEMLKKFFQKISEITDSTKSNYHEVQQEALREYTETAEQASLEAARGKIDGAAEAWAFRVSQAVQEVTQIKDELVNRGILSDCAQKLAETLVQIDKKAFEEFKKETERLADIEAIWVAKIEAHLKAAQIKREYAANSYAKGEAAAWNELTAEERSAYNNEVSDANNDHESQHTSKLKSAETALRQVRYDLEEQVANKSHADELAIKNARENVDKLEKEVSALHTKKRIREEAVAWAKLTPGEREAEAAVSTIAKEFWSNAEKAALVAKQAGDKINHNDLSAEGISLWNEALQRAVDAKTAWVKTIEAYQRYYNQTIEGNWKTWWSMKLKIAENQKASWSAKILYYQANKAQISATIAATVAEASFHEETLWDDAIQKAKDTVIGWEKTEAACQIGSNISSLEHSASDKGIDHQEVEYSKAQWLAHVLYYQAKKIESSKMIALSKINKAIDAGSLLKEFIQYASEVKQAYDQSIKFYEDSLSKIPEKFKKQWKENLQDVKKGEEQWVPLTTCIEDIKKTADSPEGISARISAWMAAFKIADQQNISLESMIRNCKISRGTGSHEALHQLESQKILWVSLKEKIFEEKVKYLLSKAEITEKEALVVHEKAMAAIHQSEQESKGSAVTSMNMDQLLDEACKKAKETEEDYGRIVEAFRLKGPENEEFKKVSHKKKVWVAYKSYYFAQKEARAARTFNTNEIQRTLQEARDVRDWDGMIARTNAAKSAWQRASLLLGNADEINPGQFNLLLQEANDEVHKNETDAYEYSLLKAEDDTAKGDLRDSIADFRDSVAKSTTRAVTSVRKSVVQVRKSFLNWTSGIKPGDMDRILTARKAFVKAKKNWDSFSQAADRFMNEPNISNIEAAQFYTPLASYKNSNSAVSNDAALVKAMALALEVDSESTDSVMVAFRRAYSARYNVREVVTNRFAKDIKNTIGISWSSKPVETPTERACKSAAEAEEAASKATDSIWAKEARWAASAARKAADFTKAVDQWKLSQGPLALQTEQTSL